MTETIVARPAAGEFLDYYGKYIALVPDGDIAAQLERQLAATRALLEPLDESRALHRYAPDKWSVKEVLGHVTDGERIFSYRMLRIARADTTPLAGFDENLYVPAGRFDRRPLVSILNEFTHVRNATLALVRSLDDEASRRAGAANGAGITARALAWIIAGHELHHVGLLRERYELG